MNDAYDLRDAEAWLTVSQAAARLGISERQARRDVRHLSGDDRRESGKGGLRVRLSALAGVRAVPIESLKGSDTLAPSEKEAPGGHVTPDTVRRESGVGGSDVRRESGNVRPLSGSVRQESGASPDGSESVSRLRKDAERMEEEIRFLRERLSDATSGWREEQRRTKELEQRMKEIRELPGPTGTTQEAPPDAQGGTEAGAKPDPGVTAGPGTAQRTAEGRRRGWWQRLWSGTKG